MFGSVGVSGIFSPSPIAFRPDFIVDGIVAIASVVLLFVLIAKNKKLGKGSGVIMLCSYAAYFVYLLLQPVIFGA